MNPCLSLTLGECDELNLRLLDIPMVDFWSSTQEFPYPESLSEGVDHDVSYSSGPVLNMLPFLL